MAIKFSEEKGVRNHNLISNTFQIFCFSPVAIVNTNPLFFFGRRRRPFSITGLPDVIFFKPKSQFG
jgi:hypothetical protein